MVLIIAALLGAFNNTSKTISSTEFYSMVKEGKISDIYFDGYFTVKIRLRNSTIAEKSFPRRYDNIAHVLNRNYMSDLEEYVLTNNEANPDKKITIWYDDPSEGSLWQSILPILIATVLIGAFVVIMSRSSANANNKAMNFGNTRATLVKNSKVRFNDVAGAEEEKEELKEIVEFLSNPAKFQKVGAKTPKGVLLVGSPGTGKTLFAKAVAGEAGVPFFSISGSDFVEMFVGVGASRVRDLFAQAKRVMPCIVFIDEIDAVGRQRGAGLGGGNDEREQTLNQLLVQMDGFESNDQIIVMAATNRADVLDPALLRPGRFDRQIYVNVPDVKGREEILKVHSRNKPLSGDIDFRTVARMTIGFTGADLSNLLNEAAILAARANRSVIIMQDILEGINKVIMGPQKKSRVVTAADKRITAYHESGHAIIAKTLENCDDVQEVSIIPRGSAAGYTLTRPEEDDAHMTKNKLNDTICMMLGGRAAEELVIQDVSTGASNDIQRASALARSMVTEWGMSELGNIYLGGDGEVFVGKSFGTHSNISNSMADKIDAEIKRIIDENYSRALNILTTHRDIMENMVSLLFEKETIVKEEVDALFATPSQPDPTPFQPTPTAE
ncbi:MAG: ATP-dependent zinc metalloprotease FtsH [Clostridia bacterium]|nr:ATP-dependent zinc metalloprotease FtsH [Clostridia bacterium]